MDTFTNIKKMFSKVKCKFNSDQLPITEEEFIRRLQIFNNFKQKYRTKLYIRVYCFDDELSGSCNGFINELELPGTGEYGNINKVSQIDIRIFNRCRESIMPSLELYDIFGYKKRSLWRSGVEEIVLIEYSKKIDYFISKRSELKRKILNYVGKLRL